MNIKLLVVFGKPGAGKSYAANVLRDMFGYTIHDGDDDLPADMKEVLKKKLPITDDMRKQFIENIVVSAGKLLGKHHILAIHQTFLKEFMREQFLKEFPDARFILVETDDAIREARYMKRKYFNLGLTYLRYMTKLFEAPHIPHAIIYNNKEGTSEIEFQLQSVIRDSLYPSVKLRTADYSK
jgi:gluconate kinase